MGIFGQALLPATSVSVETVVTKRAVDPQKEAALDSNSDRDPNFPASPGETLFQASGWFEADPYLVRATALADGVVHKVHVLEGDQVGKGDLLAEMVQEDASLEVEKSKADLASAEAALAAARFTHKQAEAAVQSRNQELAVAKAQQAEKADLTARFTDMLPGTVARREVVQARLQLETQKERIALLEARLREDRMQVAAKSKEIEAAAARVQAAKSAMAMANLTLARMQIRAPVDGVVQRLFVTPGMKRRLASEKPDSATVAWIFNPDNLQARIDVPLAEAGRLFIGQAVRVETGFLPDTVLQGRVTRLAGEADRQRNTLQVKVALANPPASLRPEILCRAHFLATKSQSNRSMKSGRHTTPNGSGPPRLQVYVPRKALTNQSADRQATVWVVDESDRHAESRRLQLGPDTNTGFILVRQGLRPGDRVILNPPPSLKEGKRIRYTMNESGNP